MSQLLTHVKLLHPGAARARRSARVGRLARVRCHAPGRQAVGAELAPAGRRPVRGDCRRAPHVSSSSAAASPSARGAASTTKPSLGWSVSVSLFFGTAHQPNSKGGRVRVAAVHLENLRAARGLTRVRLGADGEVHVPKPKHGLTDTVGLAGRPVQHTVRQRPGEGGQVRGRSPSWTPPQRPDLASSMATCKLFSPPRRAGAARVSCRRTVQREWPVAGREDTAGARRKCPVAARGDANGLQWGRAGARGLRRLGMGGV